MFSQNSESTKAFFLYPHTETETLIAKEIVKNEFEAYLIYDHTAARKLLTELNRSMIFVNVDKPLKNYTWNEYLGDIKQIESSENVIIGTIAKECSNIEPYKSLCNTWISLDYGAEACLHTISSTLEKCNARGRRKYIRVKCNDMHRASFSIKLKNVVHTGIIYDISTYAMACAFQEKIALANNYYDDLQLRLDGKLLKISGESIASRNENKLYVIMFDYSRHPEAKEHIHLFIYNALQRALRDKLKIENSHSNIYHTATRG